MTLYEHVFIARQDLSAQRAQALMEEFSALITKQGGAVSKTEYWGLQNLAYRIKKNRKGHYMLLNIEAPSDTISEMERQMKLHDDILRFQTVRVDVHDPNPSPPMQRAQAKEKSWHEETGLPAPEPHEVPDEVPDEVPNKVPNKVQEIKIDEEQTPPDQESRPE